MIWLTSRQHRAQLIACAIGLAALCAYLLATGIGMASTFTDSGLAACLARTPNGCSGLEAPFISQYSSYLIVVPLFLVLPALLGVACGSPLVAREMELGTHRMIWMQSVSCTRWLSVKLIGLGAMVIITSAVYTVVLQWWSGPLIAANGNARFAPGVFDLLGSVPVLYAAFAFALGVAAGAVIRRALPAIAATLVVFTTVRVAVDVALRPNYLRPLTDTYSLPDPTQATHASELPGTWLISANTVDKAGHIIGTGSGNIDFTKIVSDCPNLATVNGIVPSPTGIQACLQQVGAHVVATYQPADRYWMFQGVELAIFVALALMAIALAFWCVRRRTA